MPCFVQGREQFHLLQRVESLRLDPLCRASEASHFLLLRQTLAWYHQLGLAELFLQMLSSASLHRDQSAINLESCGVSLVQSRCYQSGPARQSRMLRTAASHLRVRAFLKRAS